MKTYLGINVIIRKNSIAINQKHFVSVILNRSDMHNKQSEGNELKIINSLGHLY